MADQSSEGLFSPFLRKKRIAVAARYLLGDVLDFGCGSGELARFVSPEHYLGIDRDESSLKIARSTHPEHIFIDDLSKTDRSFDTITVLAVIEHVSDPVLFLKQLRIYLRNSEESRIVCTTPSPALRSVHDTGARIGFFSAHASEEHQELLGRKRLLEVGFAADLRLAEYQRFLFGANQLAVFQLTH